MFCNVENLWKWPGFYSIIRRKRNVDNIYTEPVEYKKRMKEEKNLIVNMDEDCVIPVPKDIKTNQNAVTVSVL